MLFFLYIMGQIILYLLLLLLIILLAVLFIPFRYYLNGSKYGEVSLESHVSWLFGGLKVRFLYLSESGSRFTVGFLGIHRNFGGRGKETDMASKEHEKKEKKAGKKSPYSYLTRAVMEKAIEAVLKLLDHCRPARLSLNVRTGFDDPMYTGLMYGIQGAGFAILDKLNIRLEPSFEEEELTGKLIMGGSIRISYLILVGMEFVMAEPFRSIFIKNIKIKMKRRMRTWRNSILKKT